MKPRTSFVAIVALLALFSCTSSSSPRARTTLPPRATRSDKSATPVPPASLPKLPYVVERAAGAVIGDTGYMLGGLVPGDRSISSILAIDITTGVAHAVGKL
ncbi:MAG TPA: hypothetical protein VKV69_00210, partial [Actinomycetota bacterium]|nr:hypothetical protein [Actinomycetota bacterium]